ncbi:hypothetical protein [Pseudonocardia xishanensis]|uniref:PASTA domain-containing protein n=1 Tax=Pseudonocardia xishanensis TaxID=630995 RepID=A0ABP8RZA5_9PSEU
MITRALATTPDCRNGNCPTVWGPFGGSVIVQGYAVRPGTVAVPAEILERAAQALRAEGHGIPAQRGAGAVTRVGLNFEVTGDPTTPGVLALTFPPGEAGVELPGAVIVRDALATEEAA